MQLAPMSKTTTPGYPSYRLVSPKWRTIAAAVAASAALWIPACGQDTERLAGEPPSVKVTASSVNESEAKPAEVVPPVVPITREPVSARTIGNSPPVSPPQRLDP